MVAQLTLDPARQRSQSLKISDSASNVIPDQVAAQFNIRFNTEHTVDSLQGWLNQHFGRLAEKLQVSYEARFWSNASPFITEAGDHLNIVREAVERVTGESNRTYQQQAAHQMPASFQKSVR